MPDASPPLAFDPALFEDDLTDCGMNEEERLLFLRTLWDVMVCFADYGFGMTPTQQICGKLIQTAFESAADSLEWIESDTVPLKKTFDNAVIDSKQTEGGAP
jgi:hypothetical protein